MATQLAAALTAPGRAEAIVRSHPLLLAAFMLGPGAASDWRGFDEESAARFLLRFALEGSHGRRLPVFSPDYLAFLADPAPPFAARLSAYLFLRDMDLRRRFGRDIPAFEAWFAVKGAASMGLAPLLPQKELSRHRRPTGINLIGFAGGVMGLGEDIRALAEVALAAGINVAIVDAPLESRRVTVAPHGLGAHVVDRPLFPTSIFCLPPFEMMRLRLQAGSEVFGASRNIGLWPWELTRLPAEWSMAFDLVDEVWAISPFLQEVYRGLTAKPVHHLPPHVDVSQVAPMDRSILDLGREHRVVLTMFDMNSYAARKNPEGAIAAFRLAFPDVRGPERLLLKTINGAAQPEALDRIMASAAGDPRIILLDRVLARPETLGLIAACDVLLSLHRSEGFGRIPAEAALLGVPVVATGWSGVTSYLDETTGWPVPYDLRPVGAGEYPYGAGSRWAEPDVAAAARLLRQAMDSPDEARRRADAARRRVRSQHGRDAAALALSRLLDAG